MSQQQTPQRPTIEYSDFYKQCAKYPELPKFRRLAAQWVKKLYDDVEELLKLERELDHDVAVVRVRQGESPLTYLNCPRSVMKGNAELEKKWSKYEMLLRQYAQDLCLFSKLFQLPDHDPYFSRRFSQYKALFEGDSFGPTDEQGAAEAYKSSNTRDFVAAVGTDSSDILTNLCAKNIDWVEKKILKRDPQRQRVDQPSQPPTETTVHRSTIIKLIDAFTCVFVPLLLTATMFALALTRPLLVRIAVVGALGLAFAVSAKLISGRLSRGEIFAFTAAFFAVASVFVSTTDDDVSKVS